MEIIIIILKSDHRNRNTDIYERKLKFDKYLMKSFKPLNLPHTTTGKSRFWNQHYVLHDILRDWVGFNKF